MVIAWRSAGIHQLEQFVLAVERHPIVDFVPRDAVLPGISAGHKNLCPPHVICTEVYAVNRHIARCLGRHQGFHRLTQLLSILAGDFDPQDCPNMTVVRIRTGAPQPLHGSSEELSHHVVPAGNAHW